MMPSCPGSEQAYMVSVAYTTSGNLEAAAATDGQSTVPAMLLPQWQMKTPIRIESSYLACAGCLIFPSTRRGSTHSFSKPSVARSSPRA